MDAKHNCWGDPIPSQRKRELTDCLKKWHQQKEHGDRSGPFASVPLTDAEVCWLLAEPGGQSSPPGCYARQLQGADLSRAELQGANLAGTDLQGSHLSWAEMQGAYLTGAKLQGTYLAGADLQRAHLDLAELQGADLTGTKLQGANLTGAKLQGTYLVAAELQGANLRHATLDSATNLHRVRLGNDHDGWTRLADLHWGGADLTVVQWEEITKLGDDPEPLPRGFWHRPRFPKLYPTLQQAQQEARELSGDTSIDEVQLPTLQRDRYQLAVRAYRQLATALRAQGLHEHAARFAYRARVLQRRVLRCERRVRAQHLAARDLVGWTAAGLHFLSSWAPSFAVAIISGYGYRLCRSGAAYATVILTFSAAYLRLGKSLSPPLNWWGAVTVSVLSFHGRGIYSVSVSPNDLISQVSALEAVIGLLLEVVFIATFTQLVFRD